MLPKYNSFEEKKIPKVNKLFEKKIISRVNYCPENLWLKGRIDYDMSIPICFRVIEDVYLDYQYRDKRGYRDRD